MLQELTARNSLVWSLNRSEEPEVLTGGGRLWLSGESLLWNDGHDRSRLVTFGHFDPDFTLLRITINNQAAVRKEAHRVVNEWLEAT